MHSKGKKERDGKILSCSSDPHFYFLAIESPLSSNLDFLDIIKEYGFFDVMGSMPVIEQILELSDEIKNKLSPYLPEDVKLVQKGLMLYRQGLVTQLRVEQGEFRATVQDVTPAKVQLDPEFLRLSKCSCPSEGLCRHQMAVFFSAYAHKDSVADWVSEWREPLRKNMHQTNLATAWGLKTAKDLVKSEGALKPDYSRWVQSFEVSFNTLVGGKKYTNPFIIPELFEIYLKRIRASAPVEKEWRLVYELVAAVVSFRKLAVLSDELGFDEQTVRRAYHHSFENLLGDVEEIVGKMGVQTLPFSFDKFIGHLKDEVFELLTCTKKGLEHERIYMHRLLWTELFRKKEWRQEEAKRIGEHLKQLEDGENPVPYLVTRIHLFFLLGNDEQALELVNSVPEEFITPYMLLWIEDFSAARMWRRVEPLIDLFLQQLRKYTDWLGSYHSSSVFIRKALRAITPFCSENGRVDLFERALLVMLPYSFADYEHLLLERGDWDRWAELYALVGLGFDDLGKDRVKLLEKKRPELLIGMLHQAAQREIDQKNRGSYRMAVRHLKKLRTLYKKLKQMEEWEYFLTQLLDRTKRLRAFQEECQRSKLI
jgi:hypothetical protein